MWGNCFTAKGAVNKRFLQFYGFGEEGPKEGLEVKKHRVRYDRSDLAAAAAAAPTLLPLIILKQMSGAAVVFLVFPVIS